MGNRGCLHNDQGEIRRQFQGKRWIICLLEFKDRKRPVMQPGKYTELFFLDEATALASGHRPCAECQRERFNLFRETWVAANPDFGSEPRPTAPTLDAILHEERLSVQNQLNKSIESIKNLPDGVFVAYENQNAYLIFNNQLLHWNPSGYENALPPDDHHPVRILTPASVVRTLAAGYPVSIHPSATIFKN